jgi:hypothetical protein
MQLAEDLPNYNNQNRLIQDMFETISVKPSENDNNDIENTDGNEKEKVIQKNIPIILVDNSGSTAQIFHNTKKTILNTQIDIIKAKLKKKNCIECYIMFWNNNQTHLISPVMVHNLESTIQRLGVTACGGTDISVAFHNIPEKWFQLKTDIYVLTDGETNCDQYGFKNQIFNLTKRKININVITIQTSNYNYMEQNIEAGSNIYKTIQENKLSKYIRSFECFNEYHYPFPFINFYNPEIKKGQFSFKEHIFNEENFIKFTEIISELVEFYSNDKSELDKIIYHLSFTIFQYTRNKSGKIKNEVIKLFIGLFEEYYEDTDHLTDIFESEIRNHEEGVSKTFQQYKENRKKLFERTQDNLFSNVSECFAKGDQFISFPIQTTIPDSIRLIQSNGMNCSIRLSDLYFNCGGVKYGDYNIPMFSVATKNSDQSTQALRQWIRAIYSRVHSIQISDEKVLYLFLTDMMSVVFSDLPEQVKSGYKNCASILLDANRFNSGGVKQITWLTMGNKPKPMIPGYSTMEEILRSCSRYYNPNLEISTDEFWYGICLAYGQEDLVKKQVPWGFNTQDLVSKLKTHNKKYIFEQIECGQDLEYWDYITLEDTSETGGYKPPNYKIGKKEFVSKFVISQESYEFLKTESEGGNTKCPVTGNLIKLKDFVKIKPKVLTDNFKADCSNFNYKIFNSKNYEKVDLDKYDKMELIGLDLFKSTDYDFTNYPYEFVPKVPIITEKLYKERIQYRTTEEFRNQIELRYSWLKDLDMKNIVIAGGFCKSLIFDEKVNDIDIYMYGLGLDLKQESEHMGSGPDYELEMNKLYSNRLGKLVGDLVNIITDKYPNAISLQAYKKEFNVYELIFFENIGDLEKQKFELQDLTQMKYITKIQIIMRKHNLKKEIFDSFDLDSSCVMWDGTDLLFNDRSWIAYKYLINIPRTDRFYSDIFDLRLLKYYHSGFRIVLSRLSIANIKDRVSDDGSFVVNKSKFVIKEVDSNNIYIDKTELVPVKEEKKDKNITVSIYNSIIGDLGSLNDSRSIVKFMKYVQRQNRIVEKVRKNIENNVQMNMEQLLDTINDEMKEELKDLKFGGKKYVKQDALISDKDDLDEDDLDDDLDEDDLDEDEDDEENNKKIKLINNSRPKCLPFIETDSDTNSDSDHRVKSKKQEKIKNLDIDIDLDIDQDSDLETNTNNGSKKNLDCEQITQDHNLTNTESTTFDKIDSKLFVKTQKKLLNENGEEETKQPEEYIKVYYKVCTKNSQMKINEFDNGTTELSFIWEYNNYHKEFKWYDKDQEKENLEKEKEKEKQLQVDSDSDTD